MFDAARDALIFEGAWDAFACAELLRAHGRMVPDPAPFRPSLAGFWFGRGWVQALQRFRATGVNMLPPARVAVVLDNDPPSPNQPTPRTEVVNSFAALNVAVTVPGPGVGLGPVSAPTGVQLGSWLMPDAAAFGSLDDFLLSLLPAGDTVSEWARQAVQVARIRGGTATPNQDSKSQLRSFLAFHDPPDANYGEAIKAARFDVRAPAAQAFVSWFDSMFA